MASRNSAARVITLPANAAADLPATDRWPFVALLLSIGGDGVLVVEYGTGGHRDCGWYDVDAPRGARSEGTARIVIGASSRDLRLGADVEVLAEPGVPDPATPAELEVRTIAWSAAESERRRMG